MHDDRLKELAGDINRLVEAFGEHPDDEVRERAFALLQAVDSLHREALGRWVSMLKTAHGEDTLRRMARDPAVAMLLELYDLVPEEPAGDGIPAAARRPGSTFVSLDSIGVADADRDGSWTDLGPLEEVPPGGMTGVERSGRRFLIVDLDDGVRVYRDACADGILPLEMGELRDGAIHCPWHDCRFDAVTGRRLERQGRGLDVYPVDVRDGRVWVNADGGAPADVAGEGEPPAPGGAASGREEGEVTR